VSHACCGESQVAAPGDAPRRAVDWLGLAAAPTFALMAVWTGLSGPPDMMCMAGQGASPFSGMPTMYLLMSGAHLAPWLALVERRRSGAR